MRLAEFFRWLFAPDGFRCRTSCEGWTSEMNRLQNGGDAAIAASYVLIACVLWFWLARRHLPEFRKVFAMFGGFVVSCAGTHVAQIVCSFWPAFHLYVAVTLWCAAVSVATALLLIPMTPRAMAIPRVGAIAPVLIGLKRKSREVCEAVARLMAQDERLAEEKTREALAALERVHRDILDAC